MHNCAHVPREFSGGVLRALSLFFVPPDLGRFYGSKLSFTFIWVDNKLKISSHLLKQDNAG